MIINWIGVIIGIGAILLGNALEGGHISSLIQPTAAMIVGGGTLGATLLSVTFNEFRASIGAAFKMFLSPKAPDLGAVVTEVVAVATQARKEGILSLEKSVETISMPFFAQNLRHIIDGYDPTVLKEIMEDRIALEEEHAMAVAKVWETAGGFSPTIGIIGAVMGLIHVMANLSDSSKLGAGIAVAFVATVYGVGAANLILLPVGTKLKKIAKANAQELILIYTGLLGIQAGLNPRIIEDRLRNLLHGHAGAEGGHGEKKAA